VGWIYVAQDNVQVRVLVDVDSFKHIRWKICWRMKSGRLPDFMCTRKCFSYIRKWLYKAECFITLVGNCTLCALRVSLFYFSLSLTSRNPAKDFHFFLRGFARLTKLWKQLGVHFEKTFFPSSTPSLLSPLGCGGGGRGHLPILYDIRKGHFCSLVFEGNFASSVSGFSTRTPAIDRNIRTDYAVMQYILTQIFCFVFFVA